VSYYAVPLHLQPAFANLAYPAGSFPVAETMARRGLSLPMSTGLTAADQERIVDLIFAAIERQTAVS
jgi:UDP-2-acetamido-2-deoxy-ribo-hexuluronate aminotransferase